VFEALRLGARHPGAIARIIDADQRATRILLEMLVTSRYVRKTREGRFANSKSTQSWLASSTSGSAPAMELWNVLIFDFWKEYIKDAVKRGNPPITIYEWFSTKKGAWEIAQAGSMSLASASAEAVARKVRLPKGKTKILDLGGGHGLFSIELCKRYPNLSCIIFDLPGALNGSSNMTQEILDGMGISDRISFRGGNFQTDEIGSRYDAVLIFNIIHGIKPDGTLELFRKVFNSLKLGGKILILDRFRKGGERSRIEDAFLNLNYLVTLGGQTYSIVEVKKLLRKAGFGEAASINYSESGILVTAKRLSTRSPKSN